MGTLRSVPTLAREPAGSLAPSSLFVGGRDAHAQGIPPDWSWRAGAEEEEEEEGEEEQGEAEGAQESVLDFIRRNSSWNTTWHELAREETEPGRPTSAVLATQEAQEAEEEEEEKE